MTNEVVPTFEMTVDLNVLKHLGINLYSNIAAVLTEAVANAWDADASSVQIRVAPNNEWIEIEDDGIGMSVDDLNGKYLRVGYRRRDEDTEHGCKTAKGRPVMGRKGLGKLSLFSIANVIEVQSAKDGDAHGFRMSVPGIQQAVQEKRAYHPERLERGTLTATRGTKSCCATSSVSGSAKALPRCASVLPGVSRSLGKLMASRSRSTASPSRPLIEATCPRSSSFGRSRVTSRKPHRDIVKSRLEAITEFQSLVDEDAKEKVLQKYLFDHLWLLDPGWERATDSPIMESRLIKEGIFTDDMTKKEELGRVDIAYRTNAGKHIIVELKKAGRKMRLLELQEQGQTYVDKLRKILAQMGRTSPDIEVVFVLGKTVDEETSNPERLKSSMAAISLGSRIRHYDELIQGAQEAYSAYIEKTKKLDKLEDIVNGI
ncbi:ATP-binding protein [Azotobacter chroococcum]|uniref:ATP-binding protein n=1 Tax=Azotobacter chroococcum TaxID=353 RepID=UPI001939466A|nr:ATP-binding protein [Azotobacter chroococcum]